VSHACVSLPLDRATLDALKIRDGATYTLSDTIASGHSTYHTSANDSVVWTIIMVSKDMVHQVTLPHLRLHQLIIDGNNFKYLGITGVLGQYSIHVL